MNDRLLRVSLWVLGPCLSAVLVWLAFPPTEIWPLAWVGLVPLLWGMEGSSKKGAFLKGWISGALFQLLAGRAVARAHPGMLVVAPLIGMAWGVFAVLYAILVRRGAPRWLVAGVAWIGTESLKGLGPLAFPWLPLGSSQALAPFMVQSAAWVGTAGISCLIAGVNGAIVDLVAGARSGSRLGERGGPRPIAPPLVVIGIAVGNGVFGAALMRDADGVLPVCVSAVSQGRRLSRTVSPHAGETGEKGRVRDGKPAPPLPGPPLRVLRRGDGGAPSPAVGRGDSCGTHSDRASAVSPPVGSRERVSEKGPRGLRVGVVQPNISGEDRWSGRRFAEILALHKELTREACAESPDFVIWTEGALGNVGGPGVPMVPGAVGGLSVETGVPILLGASHEDLAKGEAHNSATLVSRSGRLIGRYDKQMLLPFAEWVPDGLKFLAGRQAREHGYDPGERPVVLRLFGPAGAAGESVGLGVFICFESLFSDLVRRLPGLGAEVLVHLSDEGWYEDPGVWMQSVSLDAMRAVENRRWLIRCSNSGPSVTIDQRGRIRNWLKGEDGSVFEVSGWMVGDVELESATTFYSRHGDWVSPAAWILMAGLLLLPTHLLRAMPWASCP